MKKTIITISCVALASLAVVSCKKDKDDNNGGGSKNNMELLTSHAWIGTDLKIGGVSVWDSMVDDCDKDDFQKFNADGSGVIDAGASKCDTSDAQTEAFEWKFINNQSQIVVDGDTSTIAELTETKMRLTTSSAFGEAEVILSKK